MLPYVAVVMHHVNNALARIAKKVEGSRICLFSASAPKGKEQSASLTDDFVRFSTWYRRHEVMYKILAS